MDKKKIEQPRPKMTDEELRSREPTEFFTGMSKELREKLKHDLGNFV